MEEKSSSFSSTHLGLTTIYSAEIEANEARAANRISHLESLTNLMRAESFFMARRKV